MNLKLNRHLGTVENHYPEDPVLLYVDSTRIEAMWEEQYRWHGRNGTTEYLRTKILMFSGHVFEVKETPKEIRGYIARKDLEGFMAGGMR
jgi:hypothetical protein